MTRPISLLLLSLIVGCSAHVRTASTAQPTAVSAPTPLFFLDGKEITSEQFRALDASRISTVEVLKGAAALRYDSRAHDGIVLITRKAD